MYVQPRAPQKGGICTLPLTASGASLFSLKGLATGRDQCRGARDWTPMGREQGPSCPGRQGEKEPSPLLTAFGEEFLCIGHAGGIEAGNNGLPQVNQSPSWVIRHGTACHGSWEAEPIPNFPVPGSCRSQPGLLMLLGRNFRVALGLAQGARVIRRDTFPKPPESVPKGMLQQAFPVLGC